MKILVTGGAGYIGSHMVRTLGEKGADVVVLDNLSSGHEESVLSGRLVVADLADRSEIEAILTKEDFDAVMHFAASISVEESVRNPQKYYRNNFSNTLNLVDVCVKVGIRHFIFSSTAAIYGTPKHVPISEDADMLPVNPYGMSKLMVEHMLQDMDNAHGLRYVSLRYFNAAGADPLKRLGQKNEETTHLITTALRTALGMNRELRIFGTDYETSDGTCVRDYIHVDDLIEAHLRSLDYLLSGNLSRVFNCGYGHGYSVREVVERVKKVTGIDFRVIDEGRREGDPPIVIADSSRIKRELGWKPMHDDLDYIISTAWEWENKWFDR